MTRNDYRTVTDITTGKYRGGIDEVIPDGRSRRHQRSGPEWGRIAVDIDGIELAALIDVVLITVIPFALLTPPESWSLKIASTRRPR